MRDKVPFGFDDIRRGINVKGNEQQAGLVVMVLIAVNDDDSPFSGVEQFSPDVNSLYRGQEKSTEAVKEREHCDGDDKAGRIAKVVRPGYQYFIDEGNRKMVRAAQVKLFG